MSRKCTVRRRAKRVRGLYYPVPGMTPENIFQAIGELRREAQDEIDRLLAFLDATEEDADLEPSLGAPEQSPHHVPRDQTEWAAGGTDDREGCEHDGREPSLGAPENVNQALWSHGADGYDLDLEDEHDGREPNGDEQDDEHDREPPAYAPTFTDRELHRRLQYHSICKSAAPLDGSDGVLVKARILPGGRCEVLRGCK